MEELALLKMGLWCIAFTSIALSLMIFISSGTPPYVGRADLNALRDGLGPRAKRSLLYGLMEGLIVLAHLLGWNYIYNVYFPSNGGLAYIIGVISTAFLFIILAARCAVTIWNWPDDEPSVRALKAPPPKPPNPSQPILKSRVSKKKNNESNK